jgi:hypothetical protein
MLFSRRMDLTKLAFTIDGSPKPEVLPKGISIELLISSTLKPFL